VGGALAAMADFTDLQEPCLAGHSSGGGAPDGRGRRSVRLARGGGRPGLIHADLHLGNALFWSDEVRVIDFDDCGFGYWLYDIAFALKQVAPPGTVG